MGRETNLKDLKKWSNKQLIEYISNRTSKLCWDNLDNVVEELEERIKKKMGIKKERNKDNCKFYNKDFCSIPCTIGRCYMIEMGRLAWVNEYPKLFGDKNEHKNDRK